MSFELKLARRLTVSAEGNRKTSPAVAVAVAGVALSVIIMLLSVAIMAGFKGEVTKRLLELDNQITISGYSTDNQPSAFDPTEVLNAISLPDNARAVAQNSVAGILKTDNDFSGINLQSRADDTLADSVIVLSETLARKLQLSEGDRVAAYFFIDNRLRTRMLTVATPYSTGFEEHDAVTAYCSPQLPEQLLGIESGHAQTLGINGLSPEQIEPLASSIYSDLLTAYYSGKLTSIYGISTVFQTQGAFFTWLGLLDTNVVVILILMGCVAAFTLISSLFIIILERVQTIGLLKALGANNTQIRRVFMLMAERLVLRGLLIGNIVGIGIIVVQNLTHIIPLDAAAYYVDFVPVELSVSAVVWLNLGAIALSWLVLMLPAMIVARISPATTMRYE